MLVRRGVIRRVMEVLERRAAGPRGNGHWARVEKSSAPGLLQVIVRTPLFKGMDLGRRVDLVYDWLEEELSEADVARVVSVLTLAPGEEKRRLPSG